MSIQTAKGTQNFRTIWKWKASLKSKGRKIPTLNHSRSHTVPLLPAADACEKKITYL